jgi:hypothetical protein
LIFSSAKTIPILVRLPVCIYPKINAMQKIANINVKPHTLVELAVIYEVDWRTLKKWLKPFEMEIGNKIGRYYSIRQVDIIFDKLGYPYTLQEAA